MCVMTSSVSLFNRPDSHYLLQVGAKWSNCMRYSEEAKIEAAVTRIKDQCVIGQKLLPVQLQPEGDAVLKAQELEDIEEAKTAVGYGCGNTAECTKPPSHRLLVKDPNYNSPQASVLSCEFMLTTVSAVAIPT